MADSKVQMLDHDTREKLAYTLKGRNDDYMLVTRYLHNLPDEVASQLCEVIKIHRKDEEGLKMLVEGMVDKFKSHTKLFEDDASSKMQSTLPAAINTSSQDTSTNSEWFRFLLTPAKVIGIARPVILNVIKWRSGKITTQQCVVNICNVAASVVISSTVQEGTQKFLSPRLGRENAEFVGELVVLAAGEAVRQVSLPKFGTEPDASSKVDTEALAQKKKAANPGWKDCLNGGLGPILTGKELNSMLQSMGSPGYHDALRTLDRHLGSLNLEQSIKSLPIAK